jgi:acetylornithine deacetylase
MPARLSPRQILDRLVAFPTVSRDTNLPLIDWVEDYLDGHGVTAHRVWNEDRTKASLYAQIGPRVEGGVVLSGHSDVVPVDGQHWSSDPWTVTERDGRLYGRGTCDMKGFVALALAAVPLALAADLKRPLQLALSHDEELGCTGAPPMIAEMARSLPRAAAVIVGEPSRFSVVTGHKGGTGFKRHHGRRPADRFCQPGERGQCGQAPGSPGATVRPALDDAACRNDPGRHRP